MSGNLGLAEGSALYVGAVLGTGILVLPAVAIDIAGPEALIALASLLLLSVPLASTFAALGKRLPDAGGISTYVRYAFGQLPAAMTSWWFYLGVPAGVPALVLFGAGYLEAATGGGRNAMFAFAALLLLVCFGANLGGVRMSGRLQLGLTTLLVGGLVTAVGLSRQQSNPPMFTTFAPHGVAAVIPAALVLIWCLTGWEAVTNLAAEFRDPARDVPRATGIALVVVASLFTLITVTFLLVLGPAVASTNAPLSALMQPRLGDFAVAITAALAVVITLGGTNAYLASLAKLGAAMGRDHSAPTGWRRVRHPAKAPSEVSALCRCTRWRSSLPHGRLTGRQPISSCCAPLRSWPST